MDAQLERLEVERRRRVAITISPSSTQRAGSCAEQRLAQLGEVAVERLLVAALEQQLVAVAEDERAKAVPLRLEDPARRRRGARPTRLASIGRTGGFTGELHAPESTAAARPLRKREPSRFREAPPRC